MQPDREDGEGTVSETQGDYSFSLEKVLGVVDLPFYLVVTYM